MPRLSLYRPNKTSDYRFLDRTIAEMYTVGGMDIFLHKYMGPQTGGEDSVLSSNYDATQPIYDTLDPLNIQDLLFANPDPITIGHIRRDIERLIALQEPRIKKMDLQFLYDVDNNQVKVNIRFVVVNLKKVYETNILLERTRWTATIYK